jgi:hypothetical protein
MQLPLHSLLERLERSGAGEVGRQRFLAAIRVQRSRQEPSPNCFAGY